MNVILIMFTPEGERREFAIEGKKTIVGRTSECGLQIPLSIISRRHCEIRIGSNSVVVRDVGSSNGTYVNNRRIQEANIKAGDTLTIGPVIFTVTIDGEPEHVKKVLTVLDIKKAKNKAALPTPSSPDDTGGSIDLDESGPLEIITHDNEEGLNPLAELEALSKQKKL